MTESIHYFNLILGILAVILQAVCLFALVVFFLFPKSNKFRNDFLFIVSRHFLSLGFLISFFAVVLSFFYSDVVGYAPCSLCWWQRIFFFPQVLLFGVALIKKDRGVIKYSFPLILIGFLISLYHNFIYYFAESSAPCDASGVSCVQRLVNEIGGYASIPMFSITMFSSLIIILLISHYYKQSVISKRDE